MECPKCHHLQDNAYIECVRCGLIFAKYRPPSVDGEESDPPGTDREGPSQGEGGLLSRLLFFVEARTDPFFFAGRLLLFAGIVIWSWKFFRAPLESNYAGTTFMHLINLPFHEAGHIFFRPLGALITSLGGTLGQLLMPFLCLSVFLIKYRNTFGAAVALWWLGENFLDMAPYINDARDLTLPLLGGNTGRNAPYGFHDWQFILNETGLIRHDQFIAGISHRLGIVLMLTAIGWGGYILCKQYRNLPTRRGTDDG
ncbi:hypothetical protein [Desulfoferrobacter suflitae]|uniref:hypothetical protein n=1 Tax=Desulfoferrobacter suflitae TaxID=2865782 RepID=UPI002164EE7A|nr:hypothetical protein [Desulfoferrobacter suflitae]MCK8601208.1 hypothetical protein [Desulfoferrobacter suflitae]